MNLLKQNIRNSIFLILAFYILGLNCTNINTNQFPQFASGQAQNQYILFEKLDLFCITFQKEQVNSSLVNFYSLNFKKHLSDFSYQIKPFEILNENILLGFIISSKTVLYCFEPIVLLFPHHYFW